MHLGLDVVPWRSRTERRVERLGLRVAFMTLVVATPVAEVDAADEGEVLLVATVVQEQHQLLMMRPSAPDTGVQEQDPAGAIHDLGKIAGLPLVEAEDPRVGAPEEPSDIDTSTGEPGERIPECRTARSEELVGVAPPLGQQHLIAGTERRETVDQPTEVGRAVDQRLDVVPDGSTRSPNG